MLTALFDFQRLYKCVFEEGQGEHADSATGKHQPAPAMFFFTLQILPGRFRKSREKYVFLASCKTSGKPNRRPGLELNRDINTQT